MRTIIWLVTLAFLAWCGWWWIATDRARDGAEQLFEQMRADGWVASHAGIASRGFPNRIDLEVTRPAVIAPDGAVGWSSPFVQVFALSYKPWHLIAAFANDQSLVTPLTGPMDLRSERLRASVVLRPARAPSLQRTALEGHRLALSPQAPDGGLGGPLLRVDTLNFASQSVPEAPDTHVLGFRMEGLSWAQGMLAPMGMPDRIEAARLGLALTLDRPIDTAALAGGVRLEAVEIRELRIDWGKLTLTGSGQLAPGPDRVPEGRIELALSNWREALPLAVAAGWISPDGVSVLESGLAVYAVRGPNGEDTLVVPLEISRGQMRLGVLPLGPMAPIFDP